MCDGKISPGSLLQGSDETSERHLGDESLFCPATNQGCQERRSHSRNTFCLRLFRRKKNISQKLSPIFYIFIVVKNLLKLEGQFTPK